MNQITGTGYSKKLSLEGKLWALDKSSTVSREYDAIIDTEVVYRPLGQLYTHYYMPYY